MKSELLDDVLIYFYKYNQDITRYIFTRRTDAVQNKLIIVQPGVTWSLPHIDGQVVSSVCVPSVTDAMGVYNQYYILDTDETVQLVQPDLVAPVRESERIESTARLLACRVLVVDDRRDVRHISQHFLEKAGAKVVTAEDGRFGIDAALAARESGQPFDLVVMDMQMPNLDGLQATAQLRSAGIQWPIIALTADAMKGDRQRCLDGGCDDYLSKPIDHDKLVGMAARYTQDITQQELQKRRDERAAERQRRLGKSS